MKSQSHPADTAAARVLKEAARFSIALFLGTGRYARDEALSLAAARIAGARLEAAHPNGRKALIYAITVEGREALVTPAVLAALEALRAEGGPLVKTYASKFSAQRGARAAGHANDAVRIEKTPKGFVWRLIASQPDKPEPVVPEPARVAPAPVVSATAPAAESSPRRTRFAAIEATARAGVLPEPPDFSAATHARFRGKLARLAGLAAAGDVDALRAFEINPVSSSPKAMARYRDLCVIALEARTSERLEV